MFTNVHFVGVTRVVMFHVSFQVSTAGGTQMIVVWVVVVCRITILYTFDRNVFRNVRKKFKISKDIITRNKNVT
jgi:hypothetical protein